MTTTPQAAPPSRRTPKIFRIIRARPRLATSVAVGIVVFVALIPTEWGLAARMLAGWDACVGLYLVFALHLAGKADASHIRSQARLQDEGQRTILVLTALAAFASLGAIVALLGSSGGSQREPVQLGFAMGTVVLSWAFTHTIFALHYAHEFYAERRIGGAGMEFPGGDQQGPDYWDFFYFSFVIGMCAQVSDITVSSRKIRRTVFAHSVVAFLFNAALLALLVNIAASAI